MIDELLSAINEVHYKPGWRIESIQINGDLFENMIADKNASRLILITKGEQFFYGFPFVINNNIKDWAIVRTRTVRQL